jgi:hypothetical protein
VLVSGQAVVSVAQSVGHSSGVVVVLVVAVAPPAPPVLVPACVELVEQAASDTPAAMQRTSVGTTRTWKGAFRDSSIRRSVAP